jgi:hypothetical protein
MSIGDAVAFAIHEGAKIRRKSHVNIIWIRYFDPDSDKEFRMHEINPCEGTWVPFFIAKTPNNNLIPWTPSAEDLSARDWCWF